MSTNKKLTEYKINLEYTYPVEGNKYKCTQFYPLFPNIISEKKYADDLLNKYKSGENTTVYYNPKSPQKSCLITSKNISTEKHIIMFVFLLCATFFIVAFKYINKLID
ncbi:MAG: DUF3592 domain-containing protein [Methylococcales bacterium]